MATAVQGQARGTAPTPYDGFDTMLVDGTWRRGGGDRVVEDRDPYTDDVLVRIPVAQASGTWMRPTAPPRRRRRDWAARRPSERSGVLRRAASIMEARREEIVDWLVRESGSTRIKADIEWQFTRAMTLEAATFPSRSEGQILPTDIAGKESRVYRHAGRRGRHDQPVELPAAPQQPVHRPRAGARQRGGDQAGVGHAGDRRAAPGQDLRGGGAAARRAQRGGRPGQRDRRQVRAAPGAAGDLVHGLDRGRQAHRRARRPRPDAQEGGPRAGREQPDRRPRRRRPRPRRRRGRLRQVPAPGPDLHGDQSTDRRREGPRRVRRPLYRPGPRPEGRQPER